MWGWEIACTTRKMPGEFAIIELLFWDVDCIIILNGILFKLQPLYSVCFLIG